MRLPVVFRPEARDELDEAYEWYERRQSGLGEALLTAVRDTLERIQARPESFALLYRDIRRGLTRRFPYGIFYRVEPERIVVLAVYHGQRDPKGWQQRA